LFCFFLFGFFAFFVYPAEARTDFPTKNTRLTGNRGFVGNLCYRLENSTHGAMRRAAAVPNGHKSLDLLRALLCCIRVCHFLTLP
jgi:hypothetical protein